MGTTTSSAEPNFDAAKSLIYKTLTVRRCAAWLGVKENTVHQWVHRGDDMAPFPRHRAFDLHQAAKADGVEFDLKTLIPGLIL